MDTREYMLAGDKAIALNYKVASSSIARAVARAHQPGIEAKLQRSHRPEGVTVDMLQWQGVVEKVADPSGEVLLLLRDPVERFRSAIAQFGITDVDAVLAGQPVKSFQGQTIHPDRNPHFTLQSRLLAGSPCRLYRFETDLEAFAADAGLEWPLPRINDARREKPVLTAEQEAQVRTRYAEDIALYESIAEAGHEDTGTALDGAFVRTDREASQLKITQGAIAATINPDYTTDWQMADGSIVPLDAGALLTVSQAFSRFEQAGRTKLKNLLAQVEAAETVADLDAIQW